ncbi:MAG: hypothetical protein HQ596_00145 [Candidatus Saganbacteria bacterium]|nr:hypothetical protein [Candidatus Saganbacteria bacterium]
MSVVILSRKSSMQFLGDIEQLETFLQILEDNEIDNFRKAGTILARLIDFGKRNDISPNAIFSLNGAYTQAGDNWKSLTTQAWDQIISGNLRPGVELSAGVSRTASSAQPIVVRSVAQILERAAKLTAGDEAKLFWFEAAQIYQAEEKPGPAAYAFDELGLLTPTWGEERGSYLAAAQRLWVLAERPDLVAHSKAEAIKCEIGKEAQEAWLKEAEEMEGRDRPEAAAFCFRQAAERTPDQQDAKNLYLKAARCFRRVKRGKSAALMLIKAAENSNSDEILDLLVDAARLFALGRDFAQARETYLTLGKRRDLVSNALSGQLEELAAVCGRLSADWDEETHREQNQLHAELLAATDRPEAAARIYDYLTQHSPDSEIKGLQVRIAELYAAAGLWQKAAQSYGKAAERETDPAVASKLWGNARKNYEKADRSREATFCATKERRLARRIAKSTTDVTLAERSLRSGSFQSAAINFASAARSTQGSAVVPLLIKAGDSFILAGQSDRARKEYVKATQAADSEAVPDLLAQLVGKWLAAGEKGEAAAFQMRLAKMSEDSVALQAFRRAAELFEEAGEDGKAGTALSQAADHCRGEEAANLWQKTRTLWQRTGKLKGVPITYQKEAENSTGDRARRLWEKVAKRDLERGQPKYALKSLHRALENASGDDIPRLTAQIERLEAQLEI